MTQFLQWVDMLQPHLGGSEVAVSEDTKRVYSGLWDQANKNPRLMMWCLMEVADVRRDTTSEVRWEEVADV